MLFFPVGFKGNLSLLEIYFFPGDLSKWRDISSSFHKASMPRREAVRRSLAQVFERTPLILVAPSDPLSLLAFYAF